jgi:hypothetical protein
MSIYCCVDRKDLLIAITNLQAGKAIDNRTFVVDITQYTMNKTKPAHHICECSASVPRYQDIRVVRLPFPNTLTTVIGVSKGYKHYITR